MHGAEPRAGFVTGASVRCRQVRNKRQWIILNGAIVRTGVNNFLTGRDKFSNTLLRGRTTPSMNFKKDHPPTGPLELLVASRRRLMRRRPDEPPGGCRLSPARCSVKVRNEPVTKPVECSTTCKSTDITITPQPAQSHWQSACYATCRVLRDNRSKNEMAVDNRFVCGGFRYRCDHCRAFDCGAF